MATVKKASLRAVNCTSSIDSCIDIPLGTTIIGRGAFLGCTDKKVSRNHAELALTEEGDVIITPKHTANPTFYYAGGVKSSRKALEAEKPKKLESGDWISLMPSLHYFEVCIKNSDNEVTKFVPDEQPEAARTPSDEAESVKELKETKMDLSNSPREIFEQQSDSVAAKEVSELPSDQNQRKRTLPDWLTSLTESEANGETSKKAPARKRALTKVEPKAVSDDAETDSNASGGDAIDNKKKKASRADDLSDDDNDNPANSSTPVKKAKEGNSKGHCLSDESENENENAGVKSQDVESKSRRISCQFGGKCYRKNPTHFEEYSHPGDNDYGSEEDKKQDDADSEDSRPDCEYGTDCYRRNPQHRKDFKHSKRAQRKAAKVAKQKVGAKEHNSDEDSYESSFIDSDDSDEYVPEKGADKDSSEDEDLEALKKEAIAFGRNKKMHQMNTT